MFTLRVGYCATSFSQFFTLGHVYVYLITGFVIILKYVFAL